jgi:peptidoglycan hydrolase-like protein with peptidoglycan-binding domain
LLTVAALSWWAGRATTTTSGLAHGATAPKEPVLTAPVVRKRLGMTLHATGRLVAAGSETITVGTISVPNAESIVTATVLHVGQRIGNGAVVAQVAGRPVLAFAGSTPMYRALVGGESGPDIAQLQQDLASIGYSITDSVGSYGPSTSAALAELYQHDGYTPPAAAQYGRRHANRLIVEPQSGIVFLPELPATVAATKEPVGKSIGSPAVTLTYGSVVVDATMTAAQGYLSEPGDRATVTVGRGRPLVGVVRAIKRSVSKPSATATIALSGVAAGAQIGSHVAVSINAQSSAVPTLAVPIGALYASGNGSAYVVLAGHGRPHVPVSVGQAVGGYVPIANPPIALLPGTKLVLDASQAYSSGSGGPCSEPPRRSSCPLPPPARSRRRRPPRRASLSRPPSCPGAECRHAQSRAPGRPFRLRMPARAPGRLRAGRG